MSRLRPSVQGPLVAALLAICSPPAPAALTWVNPSPELRFELLALSTGSRVAVARLGPPPSAQRPPLVFLHGGPGAPPQGASVALLQRLADRGVPVVLFHQAGVGLSPHLSPSEYGVDRAVEDLEALRSALGAPRVVLLGGSYGARLAYEYLALHPSRVAQVIFTASAPLDPEAWALDAPAELAARPRPAASWLLALGAASVGVRAPLRVLPRDELDAAMASQATRALSLLTCDGSVGSLPQLAGYDAVQFLALRAELARRPVPAAPVERPPALVLRPECDVMPWSAAREYRRRLGATLVMVPGMGHVVAPAQQALVVELVLAFLEGRPLPLPSYAGDADPATSA